MCRQPCVRGKAGMEWVGEGWGGKGGVRPSERGLCDCAVQASTDFRRLTWPSLTQGRRVRRPPALTE